MEPCALSPTSSEPVRPSWRHQPRRVDHLRPRRTIRKRMFVTRTAQAFVSTQLPSGAVDGDEWLPAPSCVAVWDNRLQDNWLKNPCYKIRQVTIYSAAARAAPVRRGSHFAGRPRLAA